MNTFTKGLFAVSAFIISLSAHAQFVDYGNDPASYKWNIVRTRQYNVIYPQGCDSIAYRYAQLLETAYPLVQKSLGRPFEKRYPVVIHTGSMIPNGMVAWAPRRMELMSTAGSDMFAQRWDMQLVTHESRHIIQTGKLMRGYYRAIYYLLGEQSQGWAALFVPYWFLEGDAVATETALSKTGRGRLPEFSMLYRARRTGKNFFSLDKWNLGSYKDFTGNYYSLGYNMTAFARHKYGNDVWDRITMRYAHHIAIPPFASAIKNVTGVTSKKLFKETFDFLDGEWKQQEEEYRKSGFKPDYLSSSKLKYNAYKYPQALNDSVILALRSNYKDINALVRIKDGEEERLTYLGSINSPIRLVGNRVFWTENTPGLRWTHQNYSVLKYYDFGTKKVNTVTQRQRYISPAIRTDGKVAAFLQPSPEGKNSIVMVDVESGKPVCSYDVPYNEFVKSLVYTNDDDLIAATVGEKGVNLLKLSSSGEWTQLLEPTVANINSLSWNNGKLYFESGLDGTNNIYEYDPETGKCYRITHARFGAFTPSLSVDGKTLLFSDYKSDGYHIAAVPTDSLNREEADFDHPHRFALAEYLTEKEQFVLDTARLDSVPFQPERYHKATHLFNIHSWAPFYYDVVDLINFQADDLSTIVKPGAMVLSQNALNTAVTQAGWYYKDGYHHGRLLFNYSGWYPVFTMEVDYGGKALDMNWKDTGNDKRGLFGHYTERNLLDVKAQFYVPFNLTTNHYVRGFQPIISYSFTNDRYEQFKGGKMKDFQYLLSELRYYNYRKQAKQDILPRWGYQIRFQHLTTPFNTENFGDIYLARLITYWPGLVRGDGLMLRFAYQFQDVDGKYLYVPKKIMNEARGYNYLSATRQLMAFQADYSFKLLHPDVSLTPLLYVQRLRSNVFYDYYRNKASKASSWTTQSSFGLDLVMDCNLLQSNFPVSVGARFIKPIDYGNFQVEGLFSISF